MRGFIWFTLLLGVLSLTSSPASAAEPAHTPEPARHPRFGMAFDKMEQLVAPGCNWDFVRQHLDVLQFQINALAYLAPADQTARLAAILKQNHIGIAIECGYFDTEPTTEDFSAPNPKPIADRPRQVFDDKVGAVTAEIEMKKIVSLTAAGAAPDYIIMDGPIRRLISPGEDYGTPDPARGLPLDRAVTQVCDYMRTWRAHYPNIKFVAICNFPNWAWKQWPAYRPDRRGWGDYAPVLDRLVKAARAAKLPLAAIRTDNPYEYAVGSEPIPNWAWDAQTVDWLARLLDLERTVKSLGLEFQITMNSSQGGQISAQAFYRETLRYLDLYRKSGGAAEWVIIHTWFPHPQQAGPETEPYTLTNLTAAVIRDFQGEPGVALARELALPRPRIANPHSDLAPPTTGSLVRNECPDSLGLGRWSCWTVTGAPSPLTLGPAKAAYAPMEWNGKTGQYRGYVTKGQPHPSILSDHVERTQMVPQVGADPVLRWTSEKAGRIKLAGSWWLAPRGNVSLAIFVDGQPVFRQDAYASGANPGLPFTREVTVQPGTRIEWWVDANGDPAYDTMRLALDLTPVEAK